MTRETKSLLKGISKLIGALLIVLAILVVSITVSIFLNHLVMKPLLQMCTSYVGDPYGEKYHGRR